MQYKQNRNLDGLLNSLLIEPKNRAKIKEWSKSIDFLFSLDSQGLKLYCLSKMSWTGLWCNNLQVIELRGWYSSYANSDAVRWVYKRKKELHSKTKN